MEPIAIVEGSVSRGKRIGRTMGVPTANLPFPSEENRPENGIYVAEVYFLDEQMRCEQGVLSQGYHPTLPEGAPTVEVFLLNRHEDIYDKRIRIHYLSYIRPELKFDSKEELRLKMLEDIRIAKAWFATHRQGEETPC